MSRRETIEKLEQTHAILTDLTVGLNNTVLDYLPAPDEWSIRDILAHYVDDEKFVMRTRLERIMKEENPTLPSHNEKQWYSNRNKSRDQLVELLADFAIQRAASLNIIYALSESDWLRTANHPEYGQFTAEAWLEIWLQHDLVHIEQIKTHLSHYRATTS
jgi:hypothetical protein